MSIANYYSSGTRLHPIRAQTLMIEYQAYKSRTMCRRCVAQCATYIQSKQRRRWSSKPKPGRTTTREYSANSASISVVTLSGSGTPNVFYRLAPIHDEVTSSPRSAKAAKVVTLSGSGTPNVFYELAPMHDEVTSSPRRRCPLKRSPITPTQRKF
jgi:hypothetical protein